MFFFLRLWNLRVKIKQRLKLMDSSSTRSTIPIARPQATCRLQLTSTRPPLKSQEQPTVPSIDTSSCARSPPWPRCRASALSRRRRPPRARGRPAARWLPLRQAGASAASRAYRCATTGRPPSARASWCGRRATAAPSSRRPPTVISSRRAST